MKDDIELYLFCTDVSTARQSTEAGVSAIIVDCENQNKYQRQQKYDTEINHDTVNDLARLSTHLPSTRLICRINQFSPNTKLEVEQATQAGASDIFLPMVKTAHAVEQFLNYIDGQANACILIETKEACEIAEDLASFPLHKVYMGLNDLAISYNSPNIFTPLVNGLAMEVRQYFTHISFGMGGITVVDKGHPIPSPLMIAELSRHQCNFSFLRRSFKKDIINNNVKDEINLIKTEWKRLSNRTQAEIENNHREFLNYYHLCNNRR